MNASEIVTERVGAERLNASTAVPPFRQQRPAPSSPSRHRRGSSSVTQDDYGMGGSGIFAKTQSTVYNSASAPAMTTTPFYGTPASHPLRRRHSVSSPSLEKQTARLKRDTQPCDSGYSSPSPTDTTPTALPRKTPSPLTPHAPTRNADG